MLIRINLLPLILGVLLGVSYLTYILPLLLSLGFLTVYISMVTNVQISKVQIQGEYIRQVTCMCIIVDVCMNGKFNSSEKAHHLYNGQAPAVVFGHFFHIFFEGK